MRVYQNGALPSRSYFLAASAITEDAYGASCVGATHHVAWQDIHMCSHWATATQLGRTQGHALLSSQVLIGLNEAFSYVHDYTVGLHVTRRAVGEGSGGGGGVCVCVVRTWLPKSSPSVCLYSYSAHCTNTICAAHTRVTLYYGVLSDDV
ncbi:hypothetical protein JKF63_03673 [Porcisia hertigi]|uniref:T-cell immunomodulatory protein TIP C2 domain-containing protein n=1 Tax=Porcisia hertigi TaxID=2761500 RepID=A0A836IR15_9TRYP|nr:hypothetical protein JKF63_03673 [Porcisia hertigi]